MFFMLFTRGRVSLGEQSLGLIMTLTDLGCPSISYHSLLDDPGLAAGINHGLKPAY